MGGRKGRADIGAPITLHVKADGRQMVMLQMRSNETISLLKRKVGEHYGKSPKVLRVFVENRELKDDEKTLSGKSPSCEIYRYMLISFLPI